MDCFETEACVSGMGHLVVVATHPVMLCFPGQSHLKSESSYQHGTVNKCSVFQGREKKKKKKGKKKKSNPGGIVSFLCFVFDKQDFQLVFNIEVRGFGLV